MGLPFPGPIPSRDRFPDVWKELVKPLVLHPPVSVPETPTTGRSWPLQSWARYIQSGTVLGTPSIGRGRSFSCSGVMLTHALVEDEPKYLLGSSTTAHRTAHLSIAMAVCKDKGMAALVTIWSKKLQVHGRFVLLPLLC